MKTFFVHCNVEISLKIQAFAQNLGGNLEEYKSFNKPVSGHKAFKIFVPAKNKVQMESALENALNGRRISGFSC